MLTIFSDYLFYFKIRVNKEKSEMRDIGGKYNVANRQEKG